MMVALHEGSTLRLFGVKAPRLRAYFETHPQSDVTDYTIITCPDVTSLCRRIR